MAGSLEAAGVLHAFTTRGGGVSAAPFETLNLGRGAGDDPAAVRENRARALAAVGRDISDQVEVSQVHGREVAVVTAAHRGQKIQGADGLTSRDPAAVLAMHSADCAPVLMVDPVKRAVAAVHAGWRGTAVGAAAAAIRAMGEAFGSRPEDLVAAIGPAIGPCCYEVGVEVVEALAPWPWHAAVLRPSSKGRWLLDLWEANRCQIEAAGVPPWAIATAGLCTACHPVLFFSHRRSGRTGRMAALIAAPDRRDSLPPAE
ncbi:MAG: peptidoglycan editing factor PgeF [bacterium]|nr:peptidoglycan editing factor PgeF [bacterium]